METSTMLATLAAALLDKYGSAAIIKHADADADARPLIGELKRDNRIPREASAYVEWAGVLEFSVIDVFWHVDDKHNGIARVERDGTIYNF